MQHPKILIKLFPIFLLVLLTINISYSQTNMYWVGGSGDWNDPNQIHWSKQSGTLIPTGSFPDENFNAVIDGNSGLTSSDQITIPSGDYAVNDLTISNISGFKLLFNGTSSVNDVEMSVHGDLDITSQVDLDYASASSFDNAWLFVGNTIHNIHTRNLDLQNVKFLTEGATYNLSSHFMASVQVRMYGGTWNSFGRTITAGRLLFLDGIPSNGTHLQKVFNAGTSIINCDEWDSDLTYGSLSVTGNHIIYTSKFDGSPAGAFNDIFPGQFSIHEIHLLEYPDIPSSGAIVDHNNFECTDCIIQNMVIEDTGRAKLAGKFTVNGDLTVVNPGISVEFSGGSGRSNEVILNGLVITPKLTGCEGRTVFTNVHNDFTSLMRTSGTLKISDAVVNNIQTSGGATFELSNGVLQGSSSGWNLINNPTSIDYLWFSANGDPGDWDDPTRWQLLGGSNNSNGCVPSIVDDVYITTASKGNIRIPANYTAECRNFKWTNQDNLNLTLDGTANFGSILKVTGDLDLHETAIVTGVLDHRFIFSSDTSCTVKTGSVQLPNVKFVGDNAQWSLLDSLSCDRLDFEGGTLNTQGYKVITDLWTSIEENPKHYDFASSNIVVNGNFTLSLNNNSGVTVDAGTSLIECETLNSSVLGLYDVQMNNASTRTLQNYPYSFNRLILNGAGQVNTQNDLTLEILEFKADGSRLGIDTNDLLIINSGINSLTSVGSPGELKSKTPGSRAEISSDGNLCSNGYVQFVDIQSVNIGVFHAPVPFGINGGNNSGIDFNNGIGSPDLFWIGEEGEWHIQSNWSQVDGGCPANKNPADAPNLVFNRNSFFSSPVLVTMPIVSTANNIYFLNSENLTVDVTSSLTPKNIYVDGGYINFVGKTLDVLGTTDIYSSGYMTTKMSNYFKTNQMDASSGKFVVKTGSPAIISP